MLAGMFETAVGDVHLLDPGAGVGTLTAAFVEDVLGREEKPRSLHLTAWEAEKEFVGRLRQVLEDCVYAGRAAGVWNGIRLIVDGLSTCCQLCAL